MEDQELSKYHLVLASQSPRRKELLKHLNVPFEIIPSGINEVVNEKLSSSELVCDLARQKALFISQKGHFDNIVIGADTVVVLGNEVLGKPQNRDQGRLYLKQLSSKTHYVYTGISLIYKKRNLSFFVKTEVTFGAIDKVSLELYLDTDEYKDKAGGYGIQGKALGFVESINGSYSNVVGFPLFEFNQHLIHFLSLDQNYWRECFV